MNESLRERWAGRPLWARCALVVYALGFAEGTGAHVLDLVRGGVHAYASFAPPPLQVFFVGLVVLDPLVVALLVLSRPVGVLLACIVMAADVTANWYVSWPWLHDDPTRLLRPVGLLPITLFGLFVLTSAIPLWRTLKNPPPAAPVLRGGERTTPPCGDAPR
ncbi:hypothetical protein [Sphaerisporangium corydalis]|uniref:DoxX family protein n=1 Tax=Sphaerisporangium corydalis TaxID=1441875 RepID=A0ABV9EQL7_9ACTN|nr:hypothetical protein [Sphaerisporangium corydalis]